MSTLSTGYVVSNSRICLRSHASQHTGANPCTHSIAHAFSHAQPNSPANTATDTKSHHGANSQSDAVSNAEPYSYLPILSTRLLQQWIRTHNMHKLLHGNISATSRSNRLQRLCCRVFQSNLGSHYLPCMSHVDTLFPSSSHKLPGMCRRLLCTSVSAGFLPMLARHCKLCFRQYIWILRLDKILQQFSVQLDCTCLQCRLYCHQRQVLHRTNI